MALLENIKEACRKKGMNISDLELAAGLAKNTIYKWDRTSPGVDKVQRAATVLDVSIDELMGGSRKEKRE